MLYKNEEEFARDYKSGGAHGLIFLYGSENYLIEAWRRKILVSFGDEGFNMQRLDGQKPDLDALYDATQALPLLNPEKCVLVEDIDAARLSAEDMGKLSEIFAELPPECLLLITAKSPGFDARSAQGRKLIAAADKFGLAAELGSRDKSHMINFLKSVAQKNGCDIPTPLCHELLDICQNDMLSLSGEVAKLCAYAGGGEINHQHIEAVITPKTEARVFDLGKAILARNPQRALEILRDLYYLREAPVSILATLILSYVDLYRARIARDNGAPESRVVERFGYKGREFRVRNAYGSRISSADLRKSLSILYNCDRKMKSTGVNNEILLEKTVVSLLAVTG